MRLISYYIIEIKLRNKINFNLYFELSKPKMNHNIFHVLNIDSRIHNNFLSKTQFQNKDLENKFRIYMEFDILRNEMLSSCLFILGYIACLLYIIFAFYRLLPLLVCLFCFFLSILMSIISHNSNSRKVKLLVRHLQVFLSSLNFLTKTMLICFHYADQRAEIFNELVRIIIYDFISVNIYIITKFEADIRISLFYFFINIIITLSAHLSSLKNNFFFLEAFTSIFVFIIFYVMRKEYDLKLRQLFFKQYKIEFLQDYMLDYINGLNGYVLHTKNNKCIFSNEKISHLAGMTFPGMKNDYQNHVHFPVTGTVENKTQEENKVF